MYSSLVYSRYVWSIQQLKGSLCGCVFSGFHLQQVWEGVGVLWDSELQALEVQSKEAQKLVHQEVVVEQLSREAAKHQLPHTLTIHCSHLA